MSEIRTAVQKQAQSTLVQYALLRWESAVVIALTLILYAVGPAPLGMPPWLWLVMGAVGVILIFVSSLTDADANARVLLQLYQERFSPAVIRDKALRKEVEAALEYQRRIEEQVRKQRPGLIRDRLEDSANQLTEWVNNIFQVALRVDAYRADDLLARERASLPPELDQLTARRKQEGNPVLQQQLDQTIVAKGKHWQTLRALDGNMQQAALQMEQSLTALATVYSQVQLIDAESINSGRTEQLMNDIQEQVARLNDLVTSINDVYKARIPGLPGESSAGV